jgi:hypothetical protein
MALAAPVTIATLPLSGELSAFTFKPPSAKSPVALESGMLEAKWRLMRLKHHFFMSIAALSANPKQCRVIPESSPKDGAEACH